MTLRPVGSRTTGGGACKRALAWVAIVLVACGLDPRGEARSALRAGERGARETGAGGGAEAAPPKKLEFPAHALESSTGAYAEELLETEPQKTTARGVTIEARVVPDAYRYFLAKGLEEIREAGYEGAELEREVRKLHDKHRTKAGRVYFQVSLSTDSGTHLILRQEPKKYVKLKQGTRDCGPAVFDVDPDPKTKAARWKVFNYKGGAMKGARTEENLCVLKDLRFNMLSGSIRPKEAEPVELSIVGAWSQSQTGDPKSSINASEHQLSMRSIDEITIHGATLRFYPKRWEAATPPDGFEDLVAYLKAVRP